MNQELFKIYEMDPVLASDRGDVARDLTVWLESNIEDMVWISESPFYSLKDELLWRAEDEG